MCHFLLFDSFSRSLEKLSFSLPFLLHGSVGVMAPSRFLVILHTHTPTVTCSRRAHTLIYIPAPDHDRYLSCWVGALFKTMASVISSRLHLSPKPCNDLPLPCYFHHLTPLFALSHCLFLITPNVKVFPFKREIYLHHQLHFPIAFSSTLKYFILR